LAVRDKNSKKIDDYLQSPNNDLRSLYAKIKVLEDLNQRVTTYLDKNIAEYCQVANLLGNKLVILAANGSIATQLRFQVSDLLRKFKQDPKLRHILKIESKVHPGFSRHTPLQSIPSTAKKMPLLSAGSAEIMNEFAETLEDPKLKAVMKRIAAHTEKK
jgi:hypothetical protein